MRSGLEIGNQLVSVDEPGVICAFRAGLGARWTFLSVVSGAMRATLGEYPPMLGRRLIATSSLMVEDERRGLT